MRTEKTIDILKLYSEWDSKKWNDFLSDCYKRSDVQTLRKMLYGIQAGMSDLTKQRMNSPQIANIFLRWQRSLENTVKEIHKNLNKEKYATNKKAMEREVEDFLRRESY